MNKHQLLLIFVVCWLLGWMTGCQKDASEFTCTDPIGCVSIGPGKSLEIGVLQVLSGKAAPLGITQTETIELAIAERGNRLLGHEVSLRIEDSQCSAEGGADAAWKVVTRPRVVAILGTSCSGSAVAASKVMSEAGLVMVSGSNSAPSLTSVAGKQGVDWYPGYFRTIRNSAEHGRLAAMFAIRQLGVKRAAAIDDGDAYTQGVKNGFEQAFTELGGTIVRSASVNKGDRNMHPVLTAVANSRAELVFLPIFPEEGGRIIRQVDEIAGLEDIILIGSGAMMVDTFIDSVAEDGIGMYFFGPALPKNPEISKLQEKYKSRYGKPPHHLSYSFIYDATNLLLDSIEKVAFTKKDGTLHIGRQALRDQLYATSGFEGVNGSLSCGKFGDCSVGGSAIFLLKDPGEGAAGVRSNVVYSHVLGTTDQQSVWKNNE